VNSASLTSNCHWRAGSRILIAIFIYADNSGSAELCILSLDRTILEVLYYTGKSKILQLLKRLRYNVLAELYNCIAKFGNVVMSYFVYICRLCVFVTRVYCDKTTEISRYALKSSPLPKLFAQ